MPTFATRLAKLQQQHSRPDRYEAGIGGEDGGDLLGPNGETMSRAEFEALYPDAITIGRDAEGGTYEVD